MRTITFPFNFGQTIRHRTTGVTGTVVAFGAYNTGRHNVRIEYVDAAGVARGLWDDAETFSDTAAPIPPAPVSAHPGVELAA